MPDWNLILHFVTIILMGLGGYLLVSLKTAAETIVKTSSEERTKMMFRELEWPKELVRELQKSRGIETQGLRFKSYGALWRELRPLAVYDATKIVQKDALGLFTKLSDWYFSESGGLFLTLQSRDFYFALQDLLRITASLPNEWSADRFGALVGDTDLTFKRVLEARKATGALSVVAYFSANSLEDWQKRGVELGSIWKTDVQNLGKAWNELTAEERFAILQQVGSKLRSSLVNDLASRER